ncbi:XAC2610-related protein [Xanthomonas tesorieronis]|uniref:XAC2610-related protein n=1 Tax=Xanthomonas tesorieronis TaxID=3160839 RepID=UPI0035188B81
MRSFPAPLPVRAVRRCALVLLGVLSLAAAAPAAPQDADGGFDAQAFANSPRRTYAVQDFSTRYRATLEIEDNDEVFRPGIVRVFARGNATPLIEVASPELVLDTDAKGGKAKANVHELPYGEQSVLIYDDFNFDGIKDLALMDGQNSCYHGPSYQVYLGTADGFAPSPEFTELAQNNCGLFEVDAKAREIHTMTKDGCCWHQFAVYTVRDGKPLLQREMVDDARAEGPGLSQETRYRDQGGKRVAEQHYLWDEDGGSGAGERKILLEFRLAPSGKRIVVFANDSDGASGAPYYAAIGAQQQVELLYPEGDAEALAYDAARHTLSFVRAATTYRIVGDAQGVPQRMEVVVRGKSQPLPLQPGSVRGSLQAVARALAAAQ